MTKRPVNQRTKKSTPLKSRATGKKTSSQSSASWFQRHINQPFHQHQAVAVDSLARLLQEPGASFLTWSVIGIALALPLCLLLFLQNLQQLNTSLDEAGNISLFMELNMSAAELAATREQIISMEYVADVSLITAEQALSEFQTNSGFGNALQGLDENPLPAVIVVNPDVDDFELLSALADQLDVLPGVDSAQIDLEWMRRLYGIIALAERLTTGLALLLCFGVVLAVGNTVRLSIENRREEIVVVKLVGGTDSYVSRPFLYTGIWFGVGGGIIAGLLVILVFLVMSGPFSRLMSLYSSDFSLSWLGISDVLLLLIVSGGLGLCGAWLSVTRHLKLIEPK